MDSHFVPHPTHNILQLTFRSKYMYLNGQISPSILICIYKHGKRYQENVYKIKNVLTHLCKLPFTTPLMMDVTGADL